jgi:dinuclear metal center YbgI/SA1388 family protein
MKIRDIIHTLEKWAPLSHQEAYDNCGLITGQIHDNCNGVLVSLDCTEDVLDEAMRRNCNLIVAHHPIVFSAMKKFSGDDYVSRVIRKAIKNDLAIYAIHTNLDNVQSGVNARICRQLGIQKPRILSPQKGRLKKLVVFVPKAAIQEVSSAVFEAGAGHIGNYEACSFSNSGKGTFKGNEQSSPFVGEKGVLHSEPEERLEVVVPDYLVGAVIKAMVHAHPYEEVAYDLFPLENTWSQIGSGMIGTLEAPMAVADFMLRIKREMHMPFIRHTALCKPTVSTVAVCGGSGFFLIDDAKRAGADVFLTADVKYHQFFDADNKLIIMDIGHFESEQFTIDLIVDFLKEKMPTFAILLSETNTNPVNYF